MPGISQLKDRHGNDLFFADAGDLWVFPFHFVDDYKTHMKKIRNMELRDGDVIIVSFPRSGTFWHHEIVSMLMNGNTEYKRQLENDHFESFPFEQLPRPDKPELYSSHVNRFRLLPRQVLEKKVKVIYCYRNPKATWVSLYNFVHSFNLYPSYDGTWDHFFDLMMDTGCWYGNWFDHVLEWEQAAAEHPDTILFSCYEHMKKDPVGQIQKLDQFLGLNRGRQLCEQIAEACEFSKMKAVKEGQDSILNEDTTWKKGAPGIYRKGQIADWKNWFTVAQSERLDAEFQKRMSESKLPFIFQ